MPGFRFGGRRSGVCGEREALERRSRGSFGMKGEL